MDPDGSKDVQVGVPVNWKVERFVDEFVKKLGLPIGKPDRPISYEAVLERTESMLVPQQTMQEAGVQDGDVIRLRSRQEGG